MWTSGHLPIPCRMAGWLFVLGLIQPPVLHAELPQPRDHFGMAFDNERGEIVLFGGNSPGEGYLNETWTWSPERGWVKFEGEGPGERSSNVLVYDPIRKLTLLFGGLRPGWLYEDTWSWNGQRWQELSAPGPPARYSPAMAFDGQRQRIVLFGGRGAQGPTSDTWEWDGSQWQERPVAGPPPRARATLVFDEKREVVVLFGGGRRGVVLGDLWTWDGKAWKELETEGDRPPARTNHGMLYDRIGARILLFGGSDEGALRFNDLWELKGKQWRRIETDSGPDARDMFGFVSDIRASRVLLFGGRDSTQGSRNDLWNWDGSLWKILPSP